MGVVRVCVRGYGCDGVGVVVIIFLSLPLAWVVGRGDGVGVVMEFLLTLKRGFTFYDNLSLSIRSNAVIPHSAPRYRRTSDNNDDNDNDNRCYHKCFEPHRFREESLSN